MKKIINFLMNNCITSTIILLITYIFYGVVIGISLIPSASLIYLFLQCITLDSILSIILLAITIGVCVYLFFITALIVFGIVERLLVIRI